MTVLLRNVFKTQCEEGVTDQDLQCHCCTSYRRGVVTLRRHIPCPGSATNCTRPPRKPSQRILFLRHVHGRDHPDMAALIFKSAATSANQCSRLERVRCAGTKGDRARAPRYAQRMATII